MEEFSFEKESQMKGQQMILWNYLLPHQQLGQFFYNNNSTHACTAISRNQHKQQKNKSQVLRIQVQKYNQIFKLQIKQYFALIDFITLYSGIERSSIQKLKIYKEHGIFFKKYRYGDYVIGDQHEEHGEVLVIFQGECLMFQKKVACIKEKDQITFQREITPKIKLCKNDCINLEGFFVEKKQIESLRYQVSSAEIILLSLSFNFIRNSPKPIQNKLQFIYNCHIYNMEQRFSQQVQNEKNGRKSRKTFKQKTCMVEENSKDKKPSRKQLIKHCKYDSLENTFSKKEKENVINIRKDYCLGFNLKTKMGNQKLIKKSVIKQPKGFFEIQPSRKYAVMHSHHNSPQKKRRDSNQKDWSFYLQQITKSHSKNKLQLKQDNYRQIFTQIHNQKSQSKSKQKGQHVFKRKSQRNSFKTGKSLQRKSFKDQNKLKFPKLN